MEETTETIDRIDREAEVMQGQPCIRGTRVTVKIILDLLAGGLSRAQVLSDYPYLSEADLNACLHYASEQIATSVSSRPS